MWNNLPHGHHGNFLFFQIRARKTFTITQTHIIKSFSVDGYKLPIKYELNEHKNHTILNYFGLSSIKWDTLP